MSNSEFSWKTAIDKMTAIHQNAVNKGFYDEELPLAHYMGMIYSEMGEAVNAHRSDERKEVDIEFILDRIEENEFKRLFEEKIKGSFREEMADLFIRSLDFVAYGSKKKGVEISHHHASLAERKVREIVKKTYPEGIETLTVPSQIDTTIAVSSAVRFEFGAVVAALAIAAMTKLIAEAHDFDLLKYVEAKMRYNETRPRKHGKKY